MEIWNSFNPELNLKDIESAIKIKLIESLTQLKGFKFVTTLVLMFKKIENEDKTKYDNFYSSSKVEIIINESDTDDVFQSIYITIISNIQKLVLLFPALIVILVFQSIITKLKIRIPSTLAFLVMKIKTNI